VAGCWREIDEIDERVREPFHLGSQNRLPVLQLIGLSGEDQSLEVPHIVMNQRKLVFAQTGSTCR
jgi:hypothetical protein